MLRKVTLHGALAKKFPAANGTGVWHLDVGTVQEALLAIAAQRKGLEAWMRKKGRQFAVSIGGEFIASEHFESANRCDDWENLTLEEKIEVRAAQNNALEDMTVPLGEDNIDIYHIPSGQGKVGNIILGVVLIIVGALIWWLGPFGVYSASIGIGLIIGGLTTTTSALLAPSPTGLRQPTVRKADTQRSQSPDEVPSFGFNGAVNTTGAGQPVAVVYGRVKQAGSHMVALALRA